MSNFNPKVEKNLIWTKSYSSIKHRWKVWQKWDIVYRIGILLGGEEETKPKKVEYSNDEKTLEQIRQWLPMGEGTIN